MEGELELRCRDLDNIRAENEGLIERLEELQSLNQSTS
jgi:hypothetical protein